MSDKPHRCPFEDNTLYNPDLNGGNGFTLKEILIDIQKKLDTNQRENERRFNSLENWRSGIVAVGGFCVLILSLLMNALRTFVKGSS